MVTGIVLAVLLATAPEHCIYEARLDWPVTRDEGVASYLLLRSDDGAKTWRAFLRIPQGPGRFFSSKSRRYEVSDASALATTQYRLQVVDRVGNTSPAVELRARERIEKRCVR